ncbi:MAG: diphthine synthase [Methanocellales archaeon]|nr:diphthine synthase [Methanocellales archaeon]
MLTFIGLGLYDERDITLKGLEAIKDADIVFAEFYTSALTGTNLDTMEHLYEKKIIIVDREDVERANQILSCAKDQKVVFLSSGDSMIATTHVDLRLRAIDQGIRTRIIHGPSIYSAVCGLTGLQNYRFGKSATIAFPYKKQISEAPYDTIKANKEHNLHTLLFMDIKENYMKINQAIELLFRVESIREEEVINGIAVGISRAGSEEPIVKADYVDRLHKYDFGKDLHSMVFPGRLHFLEAESLIKLASAPPEIIEEVL